MTVSPPHPRPRICVPSLEPFVLRSGTDYPVHVSTYGSREGFGTLRVYPRHGPGPVVRSVRVDRAGRGRESGVCETKNPSSRVSPKSPWGSFVSRSYLSHVEHWFWSHLHTDGIVTPGSVSLSGRKIVEGTIRRDLRPYGGNRE